jgi:hypothetical protein
MIRKKSINATLIAFVLLAGVALSGCSGPAAQTIENSPTCSSTQVKALAKEIVSAKTSPIGKSLPVPLNYVMKDQTDVVCSAKATVDHGVKGGTQIFDMVILSSTSKTVVAHVDKVMFAHGGGRGEASGQGYWNWKIQSSDQISAAPYPGKGMVLAVAVLK